MYYAQSYNRDAYYLQVIEACMCNLITKLMRNNNMLACMHDEIQERISIGLL